MASQTQNKPQSDNLISVSTSLFPLRFRFPLFPFSPPLTWLMTFCERRSWFASQSLSTSSPQRERDKCLHKTVGSAFIRPEWQQVCHFFFFCDSISIAFIVLFIPFELISWSQYFYDLFSCRMYVFLRYFRQHSFLFIFQDCVSFYSIFFLFLFLSFHISSSKERLILFYLKVVLRYSNRRIIFYSVIICSSYPL